MKDVGATDVGYHGNLDVAPCECKLINLPAHRTESHDTQANALHMSSCVASGAPRTGDFL